MPAAKKTSGRTKKTSGRAPNGRAGRGASNLEQVRSLLFGDEARAMEERLQSIERRVDRALDSLRVELSAKLDTVQQSTEALAVSVEALETKQTEAAREAARAAKAADKQLAKLEKRVETAGKRQDKKLATELRKARAEIAESSAAVGHTLDAAIEDLTTVKLDRSEISGLLADLALRIDKPR